MADVPTRRRTGRGTRSGSGRAPVGPDDAGLDEQPSPPPSRARRLAVNTAIFAIATALSRVAGLGREVVQANYFGTTGEGSAFTIASQIPNLFSNLFSQAALGAAFVPIFTELLQQGRRREAFRLASSLFWLILVVLGALTLVYMGIAGIVMPLFTGTLTNAQTVLTTGLSRVLFPVVLLLSLTGLMVAILQSYDQFTIPALAPGGLERGDHRRDGRAALAVPRPERGLLLCGRVADRDGRADGAGGVGDATSGLQALVPLWTGATLGCARCCCCSSR